MLRYQLLATIGLILLYLAGAGVAAWLLSRLVRVFLLRLTRALRSEVGERLAVISTRPLGLIGFVLFLYVGRAYLAVRPEYRTASFLPYLDRVNFLLIVFFLTLWVDRIFGVLFDWYLRNLAKHPSFDPQFLSLFRYAGRITIYFVAVTVALGHFGVNLTGFLATAGVASLAIAFATQETLSNMVAGVILMLDRPFQVGDRIEVLGTPLIGDVIEIGTRSTKLLTLDNTVAVLANKDLVASRIINHARPDPGVRVRVTLGVPYAADIGRVKEAVRAVIAEHPAVLPAPPPAVYLTEFTETQVRITGVFTIADLREAVKVKDEINTTIIERLQAAGVFPRQPS